MVMEKFLILNVPIDVGTATGPVPLIEGDADTSAAGFLTDALADFPTALVVAGDYVLNITTGQSTTVSVTPVTPVSEVAITNVTAGFFTLGDQYRIMTAGEEMLLVNSGATFDGSITVGDIVRNGAGQEATVVTVDSDTQLTLSAAIMSTLPASPDAKTYYIFRDYNNDGDRLFNISGIADVKYVTVAGDIIVYTDRKVDGSVNSFAIQHTSDTMDYEFHTAFTSAIVNAYERQWKDVSIRLVLPAGMRVTGIVQS